MLHLDHKRSNTWLGKTVNCFWWFCQGSWFIESQLMLTMFKISLAANELYSNLDSYDLAKSSRVVVPRSLLWTNIQALSCGLSKQTSCQARRLNHRCRLFSDTVCRSRPDVWLSCRTGTSFPAGKVLYLKMAIKAVLATKKLGEHLRRDAQHMRVTGALERDGPAEQPKGRWLELWSSMRCWRGGGTSTWSFVSQQCVPVCQSTTKTRQPSPTKALCSNP